MKHGEYKIRGAAGFNGSWVRVGGDVGEFDADVVATYGL
jgi:hypothetical protein